MFLGCSSKIRFESCFPLQVRIELRQFAKGAPTKGAPDASGVREFDERR